MSPLFIRSRSRFAALVAKTSVALGFCCVLAIIGSTPEEQKIARTDRITPVKPALVISVDEPPSPSILDDGADTTINVIPDDLYASQQWSLHASGNFPGASGLFSSREFLDSPSEVTVAIVDSGVMLEHEDLQFLPGYDFIHDPTVGNDGDGRDHDPGDPGDWVSASDIEQNLVSDGCSVATSKWHGTAIAGIIGATSYNAAGIAGGAPAVAMLPVRVTGKCGGYVADLIDGIRWAAGLTVKDVADNPHPADVINLSVGFPGRCSNAMQSAINDAVNNGAIVVTASTNSAAALDTEPYSPATCENVITVAATDRNGSVTAYSALGQSVFIAAPGGTVTDGIVTTQNDGDETPFTRSAYGSHYGTSIAAAHVSAAVANLLSFQPGLNRQQIEELLSRSVNPTQQNSRCQSDQCGHGILNAHEALRLLSAGYLLNDESSQDTLPVRLAATSAGEESNDTVVTSASTFQGTGIGSHDTSILALLILSLSIKVFANRRITRR